MMRYKTIILLVLVAVPGLNNVGFSQVKDEAAHVQRAIQLAHERELIGTSDSIRLTASGLRKVDHVNDFVSRYASRALRGKWKKQSAKITSAIIDASVRHGFDPLLLLAVIQNESSFDPVVKGTSGEVGLMQIMPSTAAWVAKKAQIRWKGETTLKDPIVNIQIGAAYLAMLRARFSFDKDLYLAAYNMGVGNVDKLLEENTRPQVYPQKTLEHYTRIYIEFLSIKNKAPSSGKIAAI